MSGNPAAGFGYVLRGFRLMPEPSLRRYVAIPLFLNLVIFGFLIGASLELLGEWIRQLLALLPDWLQFVRWILWPLATLLVLAIAAYWVSACANIIAAPFNTLLAEKAEQLLTGVLTTESSLLSALKDAPRSIGKEIRKILHYLPRALLVFALTLLLPVTTQAIGGLGLNAYITPNAPKYEKKKNIYRVYRLTRQIDPQIGKSVVVRALVDIDSNDFYPPPPAPAPPTPLSEIKNASTRAIVARLPYFLSMIYALWGLSRLEKRRRMMA